MTDEELLVLLSESPKDGIRRLTEMYGGLIYSLTYRRLQGRLPKEDIEECVSDIFFDMYQSIGQVDLDKGSIKSFLLIIAKRRAIKYYERKKEPFEKVILAPESGFDYPSGQDVEKETIHKEERSELVKAVVELGEPDTTIMVQKYYYGMTAKEIGSGLGMTKNAIEKRIKRNLVKLKKRLGGGQYVQ